jgi:glycosyltransferase involved in cell wall biosynthesis
VSVSEFHRDWAIVLEMCSPSQIVAIPNGIAEPRRNPELDVADVRSRLGLAPDDLMILSISRLAQDKGLEYLMEATAMLPATRRRVRVTIAGDGPARRGLERLAERHRVTDRVMFLGFRGDVGDLLAACDIVVLPSLREGLSISLLEAMAARKPIVATSIGSQREVALHGEMALLVPPADSRSLCDAILRLAEDPALMIRLGVNARAVYEHHYTENRMLQSYRQLYLDLVSTSPNEATCEELAALPYQPKGSI